MSLSKIVQESVECELSIFWSLIAENLPQSIERSALGDGKIYKAFKPSYIKFRNVMLVKFLEAELERKRGMMKDYETILPKPQWYEGNSYLSLIQEDISYITEQIGEIKKLI